MRILIATILLFVACTPRQVIQQVPERVIVKYLPGETAQTIDSVFTVTEQRRDTITNVDTVIVTKTRWRETVKEKRVIDTVPQYIVHQDTVIKKEKVHPAAWKWWAIAILGFMFGGLLTFSVFRVFK